MNTKVLFLVILCFQLLHTADGFAQKIPDISNFRSIRNNGEFFQFHVLDRDKKEPRKFDKTKRYFWYKSQEVMSTQGGAGGQLLHGVYEQFYSNKQLAARGSFSRGLKHGKWTYWYENGALQKIEQFSKGESKGRLEVFDTLGKLEKQIEFKGNKKIIQDSVSEQVLDRTGSVVYSQVKTEDGRIVTERFKEGELHGKRTVISESGTKTTQHYKKGKLHGKQINEEGTIEFYKEGQKTDRKPFSMKEWFKKKEKKEEEKEKGTKDKESKKKKREVKEKGKEKQQKSKKEDKQPTNKKSQKPGKKEKKK